MHPIYQVFNEGGYAGGWNDVDKDRFDETEEEGRRIVYEDPIVDKTEQHFDDAIVDAFASALKEKLAQARAKGRHGWETCDDSATLSEMLREHVEKGDPRDVANYCMFLWFHGHAIRPSPPAQENRQFAQTKEYIIDGGTKVSEPWRLLTPSAAASAQQDEREAPNPLCGLSWSGFNLQGDKASINEVIRLMHLEGRAHDLQVELENERTELKKLRAAQQVQADARAVARVYVCPETDVECSRCRNLDIPLCVLTRPAAESDKRAHELGFSSAEAAFESLERRMTEGANGDALKPVEGDVLPAIGSRVQIHLASVDAWHECTVVGYYVWPSHEKIESLHRVNVRVRMDDGTLNARMLCDIRAAMSREQSQGRDREGGAV